MKIYKKTIITVTQNLETRNYWLRPLSDVKRSLVTSVTYILRMLSRIRHLIEFT